MEEVQAEPDGRTDRFVQGSCASWAVQAKTSFELFFTIPHQMSFEIRMLSSKMSHFQRPVRFGGSSLSVSCLYDHERSITYRDEADQHLALTAQWSGTERQCRPQTPCPEGRPEHFA